MATIQIITKRQRPTCQQMQFSPTSSPQSTWPVRTQKFKVMETQKPRRRRDKWFSKVMGREVPPQVSPSKTTGPRDEEPQGGDGSSRKVTTKPSPAQSDSENVDSQAALPHYQASIAASNSELEASPDEATPELKEPLGSASINGKTPPGSVKTPKPYGAGNLSAPVVLTSKTAKSTSPYRNEKAAAVSRLLDPTASMQSADLWEKAYTQLSQNPKHKDLLVKYEAILEESSPPQVSSDSFPRKMETSVQRQVDVMKKKQWTLQWNQKPIVIREQAERIVKFIQTFSSLGTAIAQIDPVHIGIPWAGVCAILTLILNDSTQHKAALDGLEEVSSVVAKYIAIEDLYVRSCQADPNSSISAAFRKAIIKVYSSVLQFQVEAALHFHRPTMARTVSNLVKSVDWADNLSKIKQSDAECVAMTSVTAMSNMSSSIGAIGSGLAELRKRSEEIHEITKIFGTLQKERDEKQKKFAVVIAWISDAQVGEDHENVRAKLGPRHWDAGQWFLQNLDFIEWNNSPRGQFWLQGSVGTGKTSLASIVINELVKAGDDRSIAFYYCSRSSTGSSNEPTAIFRSLVAQLACTIDGEEMYPVITEWHNKDAKRFAMGSRLSLTECEDLLVTLMTLRGKTIIVIDGVDECSEEMKLLRSLYQIWRRYPRLQIFLTSRLHVDVLEVFPKITTVQSDFGKTSDDIKDYIRKELQRTERRNPKVITDELAERMVNILTQRAQGMFRWVELQLDLLIPTERRIRYRRDFEDRLLQLELGSGQEVIDSLRDTYDEIYTRNTSQGRHSRRLAEKSLKWVLCAARPLKIWELGAAVAVDGQDKVSTDLIVDTCSNFFMVDAKGIVQLAHLSVREYLESKVVDGRLIFSPEEAHAEAAFTCLTYWRNISQRANDEDEESEAHDDSQDGQDEEDVGASLDSHSTNWRELAQAISGEANPEDNLAHNSDHTSEQAQADEEYHGPINQRKAEADDIETTENPYTKLHPVKHGNGDAEASQIGDYFEKADKFIRMDSAASLKPRRAFRRFQRYASIYWATHCQAAKGPRTDESRSLNEIFWDFLEDDGSSPEFKLWETALLNETKLTSVPIIDPAPMIFVPATAHERAILDAEPMYERWQETIAHFDGPQPLRPSVPLIACFYGFTDILAEISDDGSAQVARNHEGLIGLVLAARNGYNEVLDLPISNDHDLDITDKGGRTALHHAALGGYVELVRFLLGYPRKSGRRGGKKDRKPRANVNARDIGKRTPLHYAAESNKVEVVKLLLSEENVDVHARNHYGYTALGLCSHNKSEVAKLLRDDSRYKKEDEFGAFELEIKVELG